MGLTGASTELAASGGATSSGAAYTPLLPTRLLDTRKSGQTLGPSASLNLAVTGSDGVPSDATAVALNLTVTDTTSASYLSVYPTAGTRPSVSTLNWVPGETVANSAIVPVGSDGKVSLYNHTGRTDVVVDLEGYFAPEQPGSGAGAYVPLAPSRIADTRSDSGSPDSGGTLGPSGTLNVQVTGQGGVPTGAAAAILNVTATDTTAGSYLTVYPEGLAQPTASNLNWTPGETVANRVLAPLSSSGQVSIYNDTGRADVVVDVDGYFTSGATALPASASLYTAITPTRVLDTRHASGYPGAGSTLFPGAVLPVSYSLLPSSVTAVVENLTAANTTASSFFTVYPGGGSRPTASDVNWTAGQVVANLTIATLSGHEETDIFNHTGYTDAILDAFGYFNLYTPAVAPTVTAITPSTGPAGTVVTITGTGFSTTPGTTDFDFGAGNAATAVSCSSATTCNATAPEGTGTVSVTASVGGLTSISSAAAQFTYLVSVPPAPTSTQLQFTTAPSGSASSGEPLATSPVVSVEDAFGVTVSSDTSTVTLTIAAGSPTSSTLTCSSGESVAAVGGLATFAGCAISGLVGSYSLTATDGGLTPATSGSIAISAGTATQLVITAEPSTTASSGTAFVTQPEVSVEDASGNVATTDSSTVTLSLSTSPTAGGTLACNGANSAAASSGVATFSGCEITGPAGDYTITASDGSLTPAVSNTVALGAGAASKLVYDTEPSGSATSGIAFTRQPVVWVEDASGSLVTSDHSTVTLTLSSTPTPGGTLTCSGSGTDGDSEMVLSGVATFGGCDISGSAGDYTLTASDGSLATAVSSTIVLGAGTATQLFFATEPSANATSGAAFGAQPEVWVEDASGNVVTTDSSTVTLTLSTTPAGGGELTCSNTGSNGDSLAASSGEATFSGCEITGATGDYTITASDGTLATAASGTVVLGAGPATQLVFTAQPPSSVASSMPFSVSVSVEDASGNVLTGDNTSTMQLMISTSDSDTLDCGATNPMTVTAGVANFSGCVITGSSGDTDYLIATDSTYSTLSGTSIQITLM
jgi:hypothetical protein